MTFPGPFFEMNVTHAPAIDAGVGSGWGRRFLGLIFVMAFALTGLHAGYAAEENKNAAGGGQSVDKVLATLNEALKENRKMRQEMQALRTSSEKLMMERNDIAKQAQLIQQAVMQKDQELNRKMQDVSGQVENARREAETLKKANGEATAGRQELEKKIEEMSKANEEMKKLLANPSAGSAQARDDGLMKELAKKNAEDIDRAVSAVSGLNVENVELKERLIEACFNLGNINYDLGRYDAAIEQYQHALHLNSKLAWAHHNLAVIYDYHLGEIEKAKFHYRQYMALKPPEDEAKAVKMRLWDVEQLSRLEPDGPLKKDFKDTQKD